MNLGAKQETVTDERLESWLEQAEDSIFAAILAYGSLADTGYFAVSLSQLEEFIDDLKSEMDELNSKLIDRRERYREVG